MAAKPSAAPYRLPKAITKILRGSGGENPKEAEQRRRARKLVAAGEESPEAAQLVASLFAGVSAVKASYAKIQAAQLPFDPESVQAADEAVVGHLRRLSQLKHAYLKGHQSPDSSSSELRNAVATHRIAAAKLEAELGSKGDEVLSLEQLLLESEDRRRELEDRLHPNRSLSALRELHLSGLNATHFLVVLRNAVKSARHFVKHLVRGMESAGWDLDEAAAAVHPGVALHDPAAHRVFAFESYVCLAMFSGFEGRDFGLRGLEARRIWDRRRTFEEFSAMFAGEFSPEFGEFVRAKRLRVVHPKMEGSFFFSEEEEDSGGAARLEFSSAFMEMAVRVWQLHCLFSSLAEEEEDPSSSAAPAVFQARRGSAFSEVYMESVAEVSVAGAVAGDVAFTVVPGFRVGRTVLQCRVYRSIEQRQLA